MRLIFKILGVALILLPLFSATAGAIYMEGQAPPEGTDPYILAASSGLATGDAAAGNAIPGASTGGLTLSTLPSSFRYPALSGMQMPAMTGPSAGLSSLPDFKTGNLTSLGSSGHWNNPGSQGFMTKLPGFKAARIFGQ